jgi:hypothetical protein
LVPSLILLRDSDLEDAGFDEEGLTMPMTFSNASRSDCAVAAVGKLTAKRLMATILFFIMVCLSRSGESEFFVS